MPWQCLPGVGAATGESWGTQASWCALRAHQGQPGSLNIHVSAGSGGSVGTRLRIPGSKAQFASYGI